MVPVMAMLMLLVSLIALIIGPYLFEVFEERPHFYRLMDGFVVVVITGIVMLEVAPELMAHIPVVGAIMVMAGFAGPTVLEKLFHKAASQVHRTALLVGVAGIVIHTIVDGVVLGQLGSGEGVLLGWGVVLHRLPVGITIWWLIEPRYGKKTAFSVIGLMIVGTAAGYFMPIDVGVLASGEGMLWLKALVAGAILHVVIHRPRTAGTLKQKGSEGIVSRWAEGIGNFAGLAILGMILFFHTETGSEHNHPGLMDGEVLAIFWGMALESAPALLLAYVFGGLISEFLPATSIRWMKRGNGLSRSAKGMAVGLPLPVCTCGVLPLYQSLIKKGAPATAAMAFLIATPELGLDALLISVPLLGGDMTLVRLGAAAAIALLIGWAVGSWTERSTQSYAGQEGHLVEEAKPTAVRVREGLREGFGGLVDDTAPWILVGLLVAALAHPLLSQGWMQTLPSGIEVLVFALLGLPIYVCASGATPIVAVLLINGVSPGAALAFLMTGPATNVSTFGILAQLHSRNVAIVFGFATMLIAVGMGMLVNTLWPAIGLLSAADLDLEQTSLLQQVCLVLLLLLFLASLLRRGARAFVGEVTSNFRLVSSHHHHAHDEPATVCDDGCAH